MFSVTETKFQNEFMALKKTCGRYKRFKEVPNTPETEAWSGAMETYQLNRRWLHNFETRVDVVEKYIGLFQTVSPKGLEKIKEFIRRK